MGRGRQEGRHRSRQGLCRLHRDAGKIQGGLLERLPIPPPVPSRACRSLARTRLALPRPDDAWPARSPQSKLPSRRVHGRSARLHGPLHRRYRADCGGLRRPGRGRHLHLGDAAEVLLDLDPRQLRFRANAARHPDLLGDRGDKLSRRAYHRGSRLGVVSPRCATRHRYFRDLGAAVRRDDADPHAVRQGGARPTPTMS